ncbi:ADP-ribosyltransferase [Erwinia tasmaniensis]|uniref:NAD(+)--protein-arginine ADP-ribosyltransferase n=1 Tax=Erwinia tasmaniensis (strain DSM 17950 / CFBP 7177 / CIP 109463 / NCPPB 4357 / Et1/99) TaxID=465817 RepID=B2VIU9_ERWT9|nr:ADP-ribosyltransferase [Erwinia tasmaniensis]CAO96246.1 Hypothetical protein ETA_12000 [Erwinia tasmaniensis Et1/99]
MPFITSETPSSPPLSPLMVSHENDNHPEYYRRGVASSIRSASRSAVEMTVPPDSPFRHFWPYVSSGPGGWRDGSKSNTTATDEDELNEIHVKGGGLQRMAEEYSPIRRQPDALSAPVFTLRGKTGAVCGAVLVTAGVGAFCYGRGLMGSAETEISVANQHINLHANTARSINAALPSEMLPVAAAMWAPGVVTTTEKFQADDVKRVKLDFSCLEKRQFLNLPSVLRQIGNTLSNPVEMLAQESLVIDYYNKLGRCPGDSDIEKISAITEKVDQTVSALLSFIPEMTPLIMIQRIGGKLFKMLADGLDERPLNQQDIIDLNNQVLMMAKLIADFSPKDENHRIIGNKAALPEGTTLKNNHLHISLNSDQYRLTHHDEGYVAIKDDMKIRVTYSNKDKQWVSFEEKNAVQSPDTGLPEKPLKSIISSRDIVDLELTAVLNSVPHLDAKMFFRLKPNGNGIYRCPTPNKNHALRAVKINEKFYRVRKGSVQRFLVLDAQPDKEVFFYHGKYHLANRMKSADVAYTSCRLKRAPALPCMSLSADISKIFKDNHDASFNPASVGELSPDEKYPAMLVSSRGKRYIRHNNILLKAKIIESRGSNAEVRLFGEKKRGFLNRKKEFYIGSGYFSLEKGNGFLTSKIENTMEVFKFSRSSAEVYHLLQDFDDRVGGITSDEYQSIRTYGGASYLTINGFLLRDMPKEYISPRIRETVFRHVTNIRKMLKKLPVVRGVVYRGCVLNAQGMKAFMELRPGDIISSKKFISASTEQRVARNFAATSSGVHYKILVEKAAHPVMLYTGKLIEAEILIEDGTVFRCKAINGRDVQLEEVVEPTDDEKARMKYLFI